MAKRILVIGARSGIGRASAERFESIGANVVRADLELDGWASERSGNISIDVASADSVAFGVEEALRQLGGLDVVINTAGILGPVENVVGSDLRAVRRIFDVDLLGAYHVAKFVVPHLIANRSSRLIFVASIAGKEGNPGMAAYSAAKAGVIGLVKALAKEHAVDGLTVNAIAPASIETPLIAGMTAERRRAQQNLIPLGRLGTAQEAAALMEYIASDEAAFTTGFSYDLSGGRATY